MEIIALPVGQLETNCYVVVDDEGGPACRQAGIIDPGDDGDFIIRKLEDLKLKPVWVAATHGHFDHTLAVSELALTYKIPFYLHPKDNFLLQRTQETAEYFLGIPADPVLVQPKSFPQKGLSVGNMNFEIIETPGHTPGSVCLYSKDKNLLFCGDLIFAGGGVGRTDFKYCSEEDLKNSLKRILKLPEGSLTPLEEVVIYPGHGKETTIKRAKEELAWIF